MIVFQNFLVSLTLLFINIIDVVLFCFAEEFHSKISLFFIFIPIIAGSLFIVYVFELFFELFELFFIMYVIVYVICFYSTSDNALNQWVNTGKTQPILHRKVKRLHWIIQIGFNSSPMRHISVKIKLSFFPPVHISFCSYSHLVCRES